MLVALSESPWLRVPLVVAVLFALQASVAAEFRVFGVAADLLLLGAVCAGLVGGPERGALLGFVTGVIADLVLQTPFGLSALVFTLAAYAIGYVHTPALGTGWWLAPALVGATSALAVVAYALFGTLFGLEHVLNLRLVRIAVVVGAVNALLAPLGVKAMRWALRVDARTPSLPT